MTAGLPGEKTKSPRRERFERLALPHLDTLFRVALRMTGKPDRAEDSVQETFLRAWKYFDTFEEGRDAKVWLLAILRNVVYEGGRRLKREPKATSLDEYGADKVMGRGRPPGEHLQDEDIVRAIDELPEEFREVVLLTLVEELKYREVAEALEIPIGTVMSRLYRGRQLLKHRLRGEVEGSEGMTA